MKFIKSIVCTSELHCKTCRSLEGGKEWREALSKNFKLPDDEIDFECPFNKPWGIIDEQAKNIIKRRPSGCGNCGKKKKREAQAQASFNQQGKLKLKRVGPNIEQLRGKGNDSKAGQ